MLGSWGTPGGTCGVLIWWVLMGARGVLIQQEMGVLVSVQDKGACGCSWWAGTTLGSWGAPGGAFGVLIQCEMGHCSAKGGMWVLVDAHGVLMWCSFGVQWRIVWPGAGHSAKVKVGER